MDKLDDLLNDFDQRQEKGKEKLKEFNEKQKIKGEAFNSSFSKLLTKVIRPTMSKSLKKIRDHGHSANIDSTESEHTSYLQEKYLINQKRGGKYVHISFIGNYDHEKVIIYIKSSESSNKTENKYDISEINEDLIIEIITDAVSKILI